MIETIVKIDGMVNGIIAAALVVAMFIALRSSVKHFAGQGGCCGGGSTVKPKKKKLSGAIVCRMSATVEGMHCVNCSNKIESKINDLDGVACRVNLKKKEALITATREISEDEIRKIITGLGYDVTGVKRN